MVLVQAYEVTVISGEEELMIEAGQTKTTTGLDYAFSIGSEFGRFEYDATDIPLSHVHWTRN